MRSRRRRILPSAGAVGRACTGVAGVRARRGAVAALKIGAAAYLSAGLFVSWRVNRFPSHLRKGFAFTPWELRVPFRAVRFRAADGVELGAWFLPAADPAAPVVVALHGYRGNRADVLGVGSSLWRRGYAVLLLDFRGRGSSERRRIGMGAWETKDLAAALEWLRTEVPGCAVGLLGYSMGGAVALMEGGRHPEVRAIAVDCAYASQADVLSYGIERLIRLRGDFLLPAAALFHRGWGQPHYRRVMPLAHAAEWRGRAVFFIGAEADQTVAPGDTRRLFEAAPTPKLLWIARGAPHCGAYFQDRDRYCRLVGQFFDHYLEAAAGAAVGGAGAPPAREADAAR
jgi:dipeptidyl aminopeptidase/acylaminoacyl peptidase